MAGKRTPIELKLDSPRIPAGKFKKGVEAFLGLLGDVTEEVCGARSAVPWVIEVKPGCALIRAFADVDEDADVRPRLVKEAIDHGLTLISGTGGHPAHFSENALNRVRDLAALHDDEGFHISIGTDLGQREITPRAAANITDLLKWTVRDLGTIEGRLQILAKQRTLEVRVRDVDSGRLVHCYICDEHLEEAKEAFDRRVSLSGLISYRSDGTPVSIQVDRFYRFPHERELPSPSEIMGICEETL